MDWGGFHSVQPPGPPPLARAGALSQPSPPSPGVGRGQKAGSAGFAEALPHVCVPARVCTRTHTRTRVHTSDRKAPGCTVLSSGLLQRANLLRRHFSQPRAALGTFLRGPLRKPPLSLCVAVRVRLWGEGHPRAQAAVGPVSCGPGRLAGLLTSSCGRPIPIPIPLGCCLLARPGCSGVSTLGSVGRLASHAVVPLVGWAARRLWPFSPSTCSPACL